MCEPERRVACDGSLPEPDIRRRFLLWRSVPSPTSHPICICPALPRPLTALLHLGHADPLARPLPAARPRRMPMRNGAGKRDASFAGSSGVNPLHSWYNLFLSLILLDFRVPVLFCKRAMLYDSSSYWNPGIPAHVVYFSLFIIYFGNVYSISVSLFAQMLIGANLFVSHLI